MDGSATGDPGRMDDAIDPAVDRSEHRRDGILVGHVGVDERHRGVLERVLDVRTDDGRAFAEQPRRPSRARSRTMLR